MDERELFGRNWSTPPRPWPPSAGTIEIASRPLSAGEHRGALTALAYVLDNRPIAPSRHRCCQCRGPHSRHRASAADRHRRSFRHVWHSVDIGQDPCKDEAGCSAGGEGQAAEEGRAGDPGEEPGGAKAREVAQRLGEGLRAGEGSQGRVFLPRSVRTQHSAQHDPVNAILATSPKTSEDA